jgi:glycopeptide antibiotics resistance protein
MSGQFKQYFYSLYQDIPYEVYEGLLSVLCVGVVVIIAFYGLKQGWRAIATLVLGEYIFLISCSTVFCRKAVKLICYFNFSPFWSYEAIKSGREELLAENIMNVVAFIPVGLLIGMVLYNKFNIIKAGLITVGSGLLISISIEALQYFLKRGLSELDDVFHNTLGCLIGFLMVAIIKGIWLLRKRYLLN